MLQRFGIKQQDVFISPAQLFRDLEDWCGKALSNAFDPCPWPESLVDGLDSDWQTPCYCNPPFSRVADWVLKAKQQAKRGVTTYMLVPWYSWYQNSRTWKYQMLVGLPTSDYHMYTFSNPIDGTTASINCRFVEISPPNQ